MSVTKTSLPELRNLLIRVARWRLASAGPFSSTSPFSLVLAGGALATTKRSSEKGDGYENSAGRPLGMSEQEELSSKSISM